MTLDERQHVAVTCWVQLTPVTEAEGQMRVLPGSHRFIGGLRGSPTFPTEIEGVSEELAERLMTAVPVEVGQAVVYDHRLVHGTPPNRSGRTRLVAYLSAVPRGASLLHFYRDAEGDVEVYSVDQRFFRTFTLGDRPTGEPADVIRGYSVEPLTYDELVERQRRDRRRRRVLSS
jgi:ectoine hydroxylase-related dioxygenase (phytanoyl-CoA dioxygenase family)